MMNDLRGNKTVADDKVMRSFDTGATRDTAEGKLDYEGFLSPAVLRQYAKFMNMNRLQSDGKLRDSDNWQKGIPMDVYMKSGYRHFNDWWAGHRKGASPMIDRKPVMAALCGLLFNVMGYMHEELKRHPEVDFDGDEPTPEMKERQAKLNEEPWQAPEQKLIEYCGEPTATFCGDDAMSVKCETCDLGQNECCNPPFQQIMKDHDDAIIRPIVVELRNWISQTNEGLEDVPELPTCFECDDDCMECRDSDECHIHMCGTCDFIDECVPGEPAAPTAEETSLDLPMPCIECRSLDKTWEVWPCSECVVNPFTDGGFEHLFFSRRGDV
jgi:hypothetical protein